MFILAALFLITTVGAFPAGGPSVTVVPPGTNFTTCFTGGEPFTPGTPVPPGWSPAFPGCENFYNRVEFQFLDFQFNRTAPFATNLVQNLEIYVNLTFGPYKGFFGGPNFTAGETTTFTSEIPETTTGYTQLFNGLYNGGSDNKINIDRTVTGDMCGEYFNHGYLDVWVRPTNPTAPGTFHEGFYTCFYNFTFPTGVVHEGESQWSSMFRCTSGSLNNYSFGLWYQYRFYNIDSKTCQGGHWRTN